MHEQSVQSLCQVRRSIPNSKCTITLCKVVVQCSSSSITTSKGYRYKNISIIFYLKVELLSKPGGKSRVLSLEEGGLIFDGISDCKIIA